MNGIYCEVDFKVHSIFMSSSYKRENVKGARCKKKKKKMGGVCFSLISAAHAHDDVFLLQLLCSSIEIIQQPTCIIFFVVVAGFQPLVFSVMYWGRVCCKQCKKQHKSIRSNWLGLLLLLLPVVPVTV